VFPGDSLAIELHNGTWQNPKSDTLAVHMSGRI